MSLSDQDRVTIAWLRAHAKVHAGLLSYGEDQAISHKHLTDAANLIYRLSVGGCAHEIYIDGMLEAKHYGSEDDCPYDQGENAACRAMWLEGFRIKRQFDEDHECECP